jgi:hypothetical protein
MDIDCEQRSPFWDYGFDAPAGGQVSAMPVNVRAAQLTTV